ncbi:unnamed protein product [Nezara viridula]|uniref:Uncharacterized protein n=1 Tax=Nezara viridula TaxID=85310 RepID=A0A9P0E781_NEZVI|nr:unnamed protein product [Nezara viridula]
MKILNNEYAEEGIAKKDLMKSSYEPWNRDVTSGPQLAGLLARLVWTGLWVVSFRFFSSQPIRTGFRYVVAYRRNWFKAVWMSQRDTVSENADPAVNSFPLPPYHQQFMKMRRLGSDTTLHFPWAGYVLSFYGGLRAYLSLLSVFSRDGALQS